MPNVPEVSLLKVSIQADLFARMAGPAGVLANTLFTNDISGCCPEREQVQESG
jgi:hypothetical protein